LPSVSLSGQYSWNVERPVFFFPDFRTGEIRPITVGSEHSFTTRLQLTQTLFNATAFTVVQNSYLYAQAAQQQYQQTLSDVTVEVTQAFYQALLAREMEKVLESSYRRMQEFARQVSVLYQEGLVSEYEHLRAQVAVDVIEPQVSEAHQRYEDAVARLKLVMGMPVTTSIELAGSFAVDTTFHLPPEAELLAQVVERNYGLQAMRTQMEIADKVVDLYQSEFLPMLFLFGQYIYQGQSDVFRLNALLHRYTIALNKWRAQQKTLQTAQKGYRIAQVRYREGIGTQLEVFDAESNVRQVQLQELQAAYEVISIQTQLRALMGELGQKL